jgi:hypothetical protein
VQVYQGLEGALFAAAEQPVDRALLVGLQVVFEEACRRYIGEWSRLGFQTPFTPKLSESQAMFSSRVFGSPDGAQEFPDAAAVRRRQTRVRW